MELLKAQTHEQNIFLILIKFNSTKNLAVMRDFFQYSQAKDILSY